MKIIIDIPDAWINDSRPLVRIISDNIRYASCIYSLRRLESQYSEDIEPEKYNKQMKAIESIDNIVRKMLKNGLL